MRKSNRKVARENNYDLLRIISALAVVLIHVNWKFFSEKYLSPRLEADWILQSMINIVTRFSVPCFVMISGAFLLNDDGNLDFKYFYKKSLKRIFIPAFVIEGIASVIVCIENIINDIPFYSGLEGLPIGGIYGFWYIYMLIGLYMIIPVVIRIKKTINFKTYAIVSIVMLLWAIGSQATSTQRVAYSIGVVFSFLGYLLIGDVIYSYFHQKIYLSKDKSKKDRGGTEKNIFFAIIGIISIAITFIIRYHGFQYYTSGAYTNFFSPTIAVYSVCIFALFSNIRIKMNLSWLSDKTFYIYILHSIILEKVLVKEIFAQMNNSYIMQFTVYIIVLASSLGLSIIYGMVVNVVNKKLENNS